MRLQPTEQPAGEGILLAETSPEQLAACVRAGWMPLPAAASRLVEEAAAGLITFEGACTLLNLVSAHLELQSFFLSSRRASDHLKHALLVLEREWVSRMVPRYDPSPPPGVPASRYFTSSEAIQLLGSTVRIRPELATSECTRIGLVRGLQEQYPGCWMLLLLWEPDGRSVFFDREDMSGTVFVDGSFREHSSRLSLDNRRAGGI
jgi:hypothetical protein